MSIRRFALRTLFLPCLLLCLTTVAKSQVAEDDYSPAKWEEDIQAFEALDQAAMPPQDAALFVGSSSIRLWELESHFPEQTVINRGFGGCETSDVNHYFDRIVKPYNPQLIIIYAGDNDIAHGESPELVAQDQREFFTRASEEFPTSHILFLPIKPSLKRAEMWPEMQRANQMIREMTHEDVRWHYVETANPMLDTEGKPFEKWFIEDGLHLNDEGYALWTEILRRDMVHAMETIEMVKHEQGTARGIVYHDLNHNRRFDLGDSPLAEVNVSNGRDIVTTDTEGRYEIPVDQDDAIFVIKPRGWRTPLSPDRLPQFSYIHKPNGSPESRYAGVAPTGDLPESIDFALYPQVEPEQFKAIMFGDPQPRNQQEVDYVTQDVVQSLIGTDAAFGVTLGDITFDNLTLFEKQNGAIALIGIPWYNVIGNHDVNRESRTDELSDESFERVYGPTYYSFDYGPTHFIVLDDIEWYFDEDRNRGGYRCSFGEDQLRFVREDLARVPEDKLIVLMMHIPVMGASDREELYRIIERRPFSMSISGHTHHHEHRFIREADGWRGEKPHHHVINVTVSGSWWGGARDERGIPHTMMSDGAPNGYSIISFDGSDYRLDFRAAGKPEDYQMRIMLPEEVASSESAATELFVNVFNGSEDSKVEMKILGVTTWTEIERSVEADPHYRDLAAAENGVENKDYRNLPGPRQSPHLWKSELGEALSPGFYLIEIRATDRHDRVYSDARILRVLADAETEQE